jgi:hypothetical protein
VAPGFSHPAAHFGQQSKRVGGSTARKANSSAKVLPFARPKPVPAIADQPVARQRTDDRRKVVMLPFLAGLAGIEARRERAYV